MTDNYDERIKRMNRVDNVVGTIMVTVFFLETLFGILFCISFFVCPWVFSMIGGM